MKKQLGALYVILSSVLFGTMPLLAKIAYAHGSNAYTVAFTRFLFGSVMLGVIILLAPGCMVKVNKAQLGELFKLSVSYAMMPILLYSSYGHIDSGLATTLHFTYPVAVMLILVVFCRQTLQRKQIACAALCMAGLALLASPDSQPNLTGILLAVSSGIVYAVYIVLLGRSSVRTLHPLTLAFWLAFFSAIEIGAVALLSNKMVFSIDGTGWAAQAGMALFTTVFALVLFQKGLFLCGEVKASLLSTFEPLTGILIGLAIFRETLTASKALGIAGVLAAAVLLVAPVGNRKPVK